MDAAEAREVLVQALTRYRSMSYGALTDRMGDIDAFEVVGSSGVAYQIEIEVRWDDHPGGDVLVLGGIDDGGWRSSFSPLNDSFIIAPDGSFVGE
jgi:hypothetical protein